MNIQEAVDTYGAAWGEEDESKRLELLERAWADDGVYTDPQSRAQGREALSQLISGFRRQAPGMSIVATSAADEHHRLFRFTWAMQDKSGATVMEGIDFGELAEDGRIARIVGFFGPPPAAA
jgi:hypothetical protein